MAKLAAILWVLVVLGGLPVQADMTTIELTSYALWGSGSPARNSTGNGSAVEANRIGLVTSLAPNEGSVLTIQKDNTAGSGPDPFLVEVTAHAHLDVQGDLPTGYDIHGGVITLTAGGKTGTSIEKAKDQGLGVRAFGIDLDDGTSNFGKRYVNSSYTITNTHGFQMEGSKEVSGGTSTNGTTWQDFLGRNPVVPGNSPPHVDEDVLFNFNNDVYNIAADSVTVLLSKVGVKGGAPSDLMFDLHIETSKGVYNLYSQTLSTSGFSTQVGATNDKLWRLDFKDIVGLDGFVENFEIRAIDPVFGGVTRETAEHFLINGFTANVELVPVPGAVILGVIGLGFSSWLGRRKFSV